MARKRIALISFTGLFAALPALSGCVGVSTEAMEEYKDLGISQMEEGNYKEAAESFQTALDQSIGMIDAEEIDISYYKALAFLLDGDVDGALEVYNALIDYDGENWEAYYLRGNAYLEEGEDSEAVSDYDSAVSLSGDNVRLCVQICDSLAGAGLEEEMQTYLETALTMQPSDGEDYYDLGELCYMTEDYENAKDYLQKAQEMGEDESLLLLGEIYADEGDDESARQAFESYLEEHPDDVEALGRLGEAALSAGEYDEAISYLESAKANAGEDSLGTIVTNLVAAYEYAGDFEGAYETAGEYLADHSDENLEREYVFLETRVGTLPEGADVIEVDEEPSQEDENEEDDGDEYEEEDEDEYDSSDEDDEEE